MLRFLRDDRDEHKGRPLPACVDRGVFPPNTAPDDHLDRYEGTARIPLGSSFCKGTDSYPSPGARNLFPRTSGQFGTRPAQRYRLAISRYRAHTRFRASEALSHRACDRAGNLVLMAGLSLRWDARSHPCAYGGVGVESPLENHLFEVRSKDPENEKEVSVCRGGGDEQF